MALLRERELWTHTAEAVPGLVALGTSLSSVLVLHLFILHVVFLRIFFKPGNIWGPEACNRVP